MEYLYLKQGARHMFEDDFRITYASALSILSSLIIAMASVYVLPHQGLWRRNRESIIGTPQTGDKNPQLTSALHKSLSTHTT
jgi:hypothetical protein